MPKKPKRYTVGRGKPPRHTQFKRGKSGNPRGRPKGSPNLSTVLNKALMEKVIVNQGGQRKAITKLEAAATQLANRAAQGDPRSIEQALKRAEVIDNESGVQSTSVRNLPEDDQKVIKNVLERMRRALQGDGDEANQAVGDFQSDNGDKDDPSDPS